MNVAFQEAEKGLKCNEVPVGAVLYSPQNQKILAKGHNMCELYQSRLLHAEIVCLNQISLQTKYHTEEIWALITLEPCAICIGHMLMHNVTRLYYALDDYKYGFFNGSYMNLRFDLKRIQIHVGLMEDRSRILLKDFFTTLRQK